MKNNIGKSLILFSIACCLTQSSYAATTIDDLKLPKDPAFRLGVGKDIEKEFKVIDLAEQEKNKTTSYDETYIRSITNADMTLKEISKQISKSLEIDKEEMLEDIQILWAGAASKSETIKFAIYKLSNPDQDKPKDSIVKKIVRPIASFSSVAGAGFINPVAATGAMMSGSLLNSLSFNDKDLNYKFTKVTDSDMIILIQKVDNLQKRMISEYFDYMTSAKVLKMSIDTLNKREKYYNVAKAGSKDDLLIADSYYRVAIDNRSKAELEFLTQRAALEQLVGTQALAQFETKLIEREKKIN